MPSVGTIKPVAVTDDDSKTIREDQQLCDCGEAGVEIAALM